MSGDYLSDLGTFRLSPGEWIESTQLGFNASGFYAAADLPGADEGASPTATIEGDVLDSRCGELRLTRASTTPSDDALAAVAAAAPAARGAAAEEPGATADESGAPAETTIELESDTFRTGEPVVIRVTGLPGNESDWVTLVDSRASDGGSMEYVYTEGVTEGTWTFTAPVPGNYEVRVHIDYYGGDNSVAARKSVTIVD